MAEYINKKTAISLIKQYGHDAIDGGRYSLDTVDDCVELANCIKALPTEDVAPVVHGRWEWFDEDTGTPFTGYEREWGWRCSRCKHELPDDYDDPDYRPMLDYCPNCGAKMDIKDGGDNDAAD